MPAGSAGRGVRRIDQHFVEEEIHVWGADAAMRATQRLALRALDLFVKFAFRTRLSRIGANSPALKSALAEYVLDAFEAGREGFEIGSGADGLNALEAASRDRPDRPNRRPSTARTSS